MRLAIADPPYLGRAERWYGRGRGYKRGAATAADVHPSASEWDQPARHAQLVADLERDFDGYAIAAAADSLAVYLAAAPQLRVMVWHRGNSVPSGSRIANQWEPVLIRVPDGRNGRTHGLATADVLRSGVRQTGFLGSKPAEWTRWVLTALGYDTETDTVTDLFPGSGAVTRAIEAVLI